MNYISTPEARSRLHLSSSLPPFLYSFPLSFPPRWCFVGKIGGIIHDNVLFAIRNCSKFGAVTAMQLVIPLVFVSIAPKQKRNY